MKETKKKQGHHSSIFVEKGEVGRILRNHNTTNPGQDTFEDCPVNSSRTTLNLFLLFKLIYAGAFYSIIIFKSDMSSLFKITVGLFGLIMIVASIYLEYYAEDLKSKIDKSICGAKTYITMGACLIFILSCCVLRYDNQIDDAILFTMLILVNTVNEVLRLTDYIYPERNNYIKLTGFKNLWIILLPILLILQIYCNLHFNLVFIFILGNSIMTIILEKHSIYFLS